MTKRRRVEAQFLPAAHELGTFPLAWWPRASITNKGHETAHGLRLQWLNLVVDLWCHVPAPNS